MSDVFEVRDLRNKQFFMVDDEYLNGYARLCGINATGVYCSLCRHANKSQTCFPSKKLISEELAISERTVYSAIKLLELWGIIKIEDKERKKDGTFKSLTYVLADKKYWISKPSANSADGNKQQYPSANNDTIHRHQLPSKGTHIEGNTIKDTEQSSEEVFSLEEKLLKMESKENSAQDIIATFIREKPVLVENSKQLAGVISRYIRIAQKLSGAYTTKQILTAIDSIKEDNRKRERKGDTFDWTVETIYKYLTK